MARDLPLTRIRKRVEERGTEGKFRRWCQRHGHDGATAACIAEGLKSDDKGVQAMAKAAKAFASGRAAKRRKAGRSRRLTRS